jgi:GTP-binding protein
MRNQLTNLFVLIDSRHEAQTIDLEFMQWLGINGIPFSIVFTKSDKLSASRFNENIKAYKDKLLEQWEELPPVFLTSSEKSIGRDDILNYIASINLQLKS